MKELLCTLTGFKGDFPAIAKPISRLIHKNEAYEITSTCGEVSISVYAHLVKEKHKYAKETGTRLEFLYS